MKITRLICDECQKIIEKDTFFHLHLEKESTPRDDSIRFSRGDWPIHNADLCSIECAKKYFKKIEENE